MNSTLFILLIFILGVVAPPPPPAEIPSTPHYLPNAPAPAPARPDRPRPVRSPEPSPSTTPSLVCAQNQVYSECHSACPLVCGQKPAEVCITLCVSGCGCEPGLWKRSDGYCVSNCTTDCSADSDCGRNRICRAAQGVDGCLDTNECVPAAKRGERCEGFVMPCYSSRCGSGLRCELSSIPDAGGVCVNDRDRPRPRPRI
eukprot:c2015_g1_i1.p1 GENE.c2015_g1_i1~~c2015_g1_i1.p1  ORF type:complete len:200 (+),score=86.74 c2015_g1_i1:25-624(+)